MSTPDLTISAEGELTAPTPPSAEKLPRRTFTVLAVLLVGAFVVILNETAMNVALSRIMSDLGVLRRFLSFGLVVLLMNSIHIVVVVSIMVVTLWQVGIAVMVLVIPVIIATFVLMGRFGKISRRVQDQTGDVASSAEESLHGVRVIRSFGRA